MASFAINSVGEPLLKRQRVVKAEPGSPAAANTFSSRASGGIVASPSRRSSFGASREALTSPARPRSTSLCFDDDEGRPSVTAIPLVPSVIYPVSHVDKAEALTSSRSGLFSSLPDCPFGAGEPIAAVVSSEAWPISLAQTLADILASEVAQPTPADADSAGPSSRLQNSRVVSDAQVVSPGSESDVASNMSMCTEVSDQPLIVDQDEGQPEDWICLLCDEKYQACRGGAGHVFSHVAAHLAAYLPDGKVPDNSHRSSFAQELMRRVRLAKEGKTVEENLSAYDFLVLVAFSAGFMRRRESTTPPTFVAVPSSSFLGQQAAMSFFRSHCPPRPLPVENRRLVKLSKGEYEMRVPVTSGPPLSFCIATSRSRPGIVWPGLFTAFHTVRFDFSGNDLPNDIVISFGNLHGRVVVQGSFGLADRSIQALDVPFETQLAHLQLMASLALPSTFCPPTRRDSECILQLFDCPACGQRNAVTLGTFETACSRCSVVSCALCTTYEDARVHDHSDDINEPSSTNAAAVSVLYFDEPDLGDPFRLNAPLRAIWGDHSDFKDLEIASVCDIQDNLSGFSGDMLPRVAAKFPLAVMGLLPSFEPKQLSERVVSCVTDMNMSKLQSLQMHEAAMAGMNRMRLTDADPYRLGDTVWQYELPTPAFDSRVRCMLLAVKPHVSSASICTTLLHRMRASATPSVLVLTRSVPNFHSMSDCLVLTSESTIINEVVQRRGAIPFSDVRLLAEFFQESARRTSPEPAAVVVKTESSDSESAQSYSTKWSPASTSKSDKKRKRAAIVHPGNSNGTDLCAFCGHLGTRTAVTKHVVTHHLVPCVDAAMRRLEAQEKRGVRGTTRDRRLRLLSEHLLTGSRLESWDETRTGGSRAIELLKYSPGVSVNAGTQYPIEISSESLLLPEVDDTLIRKIIVAWRARWPIVRPTADRLEDGDLLDPDEWQE